MRRSAAPSQLHKRTQGQFRPPFLSPPAKKLCTSEPNHGQDVPKIAPIAEISASTEKAPVRSHLEILSLIKKPPVQPDTRNVNEIPTSVDGFENQSFGETSLQNADSSQISSTSTEYPDSTQRILTPNIQNVSSFSRQPDMQSRGPSCQRSEKKVVVHSAATSQSGIENQEPHSSKYFSVVWCKRSNKKHKKWEGDAVLIAKGRTATLKDMEGKEIGRGSGYKLTDLAALDDGSTLPVGGKEIEIQGVIAAADYASGRCFQGSVVIEDATSTEHVAPVRPKPKPFKLPTLNKPSQGSTAPRGSSVPLYDITNPDVVVLPRPPSQHQWRCNTEKAPLVDVAVDPIIGKHLRPHQREGVIFLYECVMAYKVPNSYGAILADEMGLGKTLQCIALAWTLLKQGPYGRIPVVKRVLVVTPSSLSVNWGKEFKKWLGKERINVYIVDQNNKVEQYANYRDKPVMIISYEMFLRSAEAIEALKFDLLLCDEGHRLKNANIKTTSLLASLSCKRRVILTGTPIQNDLKEYYALVEFVNPGVFGTPASFRRIYEEPIIASQQPMASEGEKELGASRASQLNRLTSLFTLRRTQEIINRYLPPKVEFVVFCQPSETQLQMYDSIVGCRSMHQILNSMDASDHLSAILALRKLCNHPALLTKVKDGESTCALVSEIANLLPEHIEPNVFEESDSGKLAVVSCMLWTLTEIGREKIVIVSNYTSTLDMLAQLCEKYNYPYLRLDGSTPTSKRQTLVDQFNNCYSPSRVFLLSAKAGGVGLNLVGASRIILYDIDWNPATDLQAMARVWRDGQKEKVFIYRLLITGSMDEKMYQRQIKKQSLSGAVVDARDSDKVHFSTAELKDLFTLYSDTECLTHDLLKCNCDHSGDLSTISQIAEPPSERACQLGAVTSSLTPSNTTMDQLQSWAHIGHPLNPDVIKDQCLESAADFITFVFRNESSHKED